MYEYYNDYLRCNVLLCGSIHEAREIVESMYGGKFVLNLDRTQSVDYGGIGVGEIVATDAEGTEILCGSRMFLM